MILIGGESLSLLTHSGQPHRIIKAVLRSKSRLEARKLALPYNIRVFGALTAC